MSRLPIINLSHASMLQYVPQWLIEHSQRYEELCEELRAIINDGDKAEAIIHNAERATDKIAYLEHHRGLALRGGYDNDYSVWRFSEDDI